MIRYKKLLYVPELMAGALAYCVELNRKLNKKTAGKILLVIV